ncbi:hypothetical protein BVC80_1835g538 [Macleaya cordata]|uniref:Uncharacterized protein n=1 Tax=Macleaya cordata TaxID=56857 RepID=A0A200R609_MACCD|nr:hypothetical protein BVC80_1835g538 [Macleaya cordata]
MWQFVVAVAVAGCGFYAKRFLNSNVDPVKVDASEEQSDKSAQEENGVVVERKEEKKSVDLVKPEVLIPSIGVSFRVPSGSSEICDSGSSEKQNLVAEEEGIFRFSSLDRSDGSGSRSSTKGLLKKVGSRRNVDSVSNKRRIRVDNRSGFMADNKLVVEKQRKNGRKFSFCLKRRRTSKNAFRKCVSCSSEGDSFFGWGLGLGIMYMVSAGKAEMNKMNDAIEETTKVINNLKSELHKRKLSRNVQNMGCKNRIDRCPEETVGENKKRPLTKSCIEGASLDDTQVFGLSTTDDGDCASSILTEESELEVLEIDQLEAELASELLKIPDQLDPEYQVEVASTELSVHVPPGPQGPLGIDSKSFQFHGVSPSELDNKLCHLLMEHQESQILELESNLNSSQVKLHEKEAELQRLKDVVRRLTDFSLETVSGMASDPKDLN